MGHPTDTYPLSSAQQDVWVDQMLHPGSCRYNIGGYVRIDGAVDTERFVAAVRLVFDRCDALRIRMHPGWDPPTQSFDACLTDVPLVDFSGAGDGDAQALAWMERTFAEPFALDQSPLVHFALVRARADRFYWFKKYHHVVTDGWGISLVARRVAAAYASTRLVADPAAETFLSYRDFVRHDVAYLESEDCERDIRYWVDRLAGTEPRLFARRGAPSAGAARSQRLRWQVPRDSYRQWEAFARACKASPFSLLLTAAHGLFSREFRTADLTIGLPVLNRATAFRGTVGLCAGVIAARVNLSPDQGMSTLAPAVQRLLRRDFRHQRLPVGMTRRVLRQAAGTEGSLFDITFSFEHHDYTLQFGGCRARATALAHNTEPAVVALYLRDYADDEPLEFDLDYRCDVLDDDAAAQIKSGLFALLDRGCRQPDVPMSRLDLLSAAERERVTVAFNQTGQDWGFGEQTFVELFDRIAGERGAAVALVCGEETVSYAALAGRANALAAALRERGVGRDRLVGLLLGRGIEFVVGVLGVWKAGGAYLPLDPGYPRERLAYMVGDARPLLVLTAEGRAAVLAGVESVGLSELAPPGARGDAALDPLGADDPPVADDLAYVIYTSGSTGRPKGVMVAHRGVLNLARAQIEGFGIAPASRVLQFASPSFDASVSELVTALGAGATLVLPEGSTVLAGAGLRTLLSEHGVSHVTLPPSVLAAEAGSLPPTLTLVVAGEACPAELVSQWAPGRRFVNA